MTKTNVQSTPSNSQHHDTPNNKTHVIKFRVTAEEKASLELTCKLLNAVYLMPDETALRELSEGVIAKLKLLTDAEFAELEFPPD